MSIFLNLRPFFLACPQPSWNWPHSFQAWPPLRTYPSLPPIHWTVELRSADSSEQVRFCICGKVLSLVQSGMQPAAAYSQRLRQRRQAERQWRTTVDNNSQRTVLVLAGRSTTEQIFNIRILCEKYFQHQQDLYHVFIDFKKAFDRVLQAALWATMKKYNISTNLIQVSKTSIARPLVQPSSTAA